MTESVQNTLIIAGFAFLTTCMAIVQTWTAYWIRRLEKNTNSMKDALVKITGESEFAKGKLEGENTPQMIHNKEN